MNESRMRHRIWSSLVLALAAVSAAVAPVSAGDWKWSITPYAWATKLDIEVSVDDQQLASGEMSLGDLLEDTQFTAQIHFEGQKQRHGLMLDVFRVDLSDDGRTFALPVPPGGSATAAGDFDLTIVEAGGIYNPRADGTGFALLYGVRAIERTADIDARFDLAPGMSLSRHYDVGEWLVDAMLGVRYAGRFARHWSYEARADASAGDTNLTWSAGAGLGYSFGDTDRYTLLVGYRHMDFDFDKDHRVVTTNIDATLSGFLTGFRFSF